MIRRPPRDGQSRIRRSLLLLAVALVLWAPAPWAKSAAIAAGPAPDPSTLPSPQPTLEEAARRFASLWATGNSGALVGMLSPEGIRLALSGQGHASVGTRQAAAALRDFHSLHLPGTARVTRVSLVEGGAPRGFAEVDWRTTTESREPVTYALFVAFHQEDGGWRVSEIRVLR